MSYCLYSFKNFLNNEHCFPKQLQKNYFSNKKQIYQKKTGFSLVVLYWPMLDKMKIPLQRIGRIFFTPMAYTNVIVCQFTTWLIAIFFIILHSTVFFKIVVYTIFCTVFTFTFCQQIQNFEIFFVLFLLSFRVHKKMIEQNGIALYGRKISWVNWRQYSFFRFWSK